VVSQERRGEDRCFPWIYSTRPNDAAAQEITEKILIRISGQDGGMQDPVPERVASNLCMILAELKRVDRTTAAVRRMRRLQGRVRVQTGCREMSMNFKTRLILYGSLRKFAKGESDDTMEVELMEASSISGFFKRFNIPEERVQLVMINHRAVSRGSVIHPGDRVALFPREYPIFADWNDMRCKSV
jgi:hypothetical protein